jgi:hypothetical protein
VEELLAGEPQLGRSGVPPTIQDVIEVRLNALPDDSQRVVRIAPSSGGRRSTTCWPTLQACPRSS